jgi:hypothetical protein
VSSFRNEPIAKLRWQGKVSQKPSEFVVRSKHALGNQIPESSGPEEEAKKGDEQVGGIVEFGVIEFGVVEFGVVGLGTVGLVAGIERVIPDGEVCPAVIIWREFGRRL